MFITATGHPDILTAPFFDAVADGAVAVLVTDYMQTEGLDAS